jgi:hypothetical protein
MQDQESAEFIDLTESQHPLQVTLIDHSPPEEFDTNIEKSPAKNIL